MPFANTQPLRREIAAAIPSRPFSIEFWDGSELPATAANGAPTPRFRVRGPEAIAQALGAPGQLGLGRAYVSGRLQVDDIDAVMALLADWQPPAIETKQRLRLMAAAARAVGLTRPPRAPAAELKPQSRKHSRERDRRAVRHHYDVSNDYFRLFLGESMTYSCAIFSRGAEDLVEAQRTKNDLVATKLALREGDRVLDVGCGWGSFALLAAGEYGAKVLGVTLSEPQAQLARQRAEQAGLADRIEIQVRDYRDLAGERFDAISSIGMVEHVGEAQIDEYARTLASLLDSGGRLLNHGITRLRHSDPDAGDFSERYVFPDAEPLHLSRILLALERAGLEPHHAEDFRLDYAETLRHWAENFDANLAEAERLGGAERVRVWRLYLRAARNGFLSGFTSIFQVRATKA